MKIQTNLIIFCLILNPGPVTVKHHHETLNLVDMVAARWRGVGKKPERKGVILV